MHQPWLLLVARSISGENKQELLEAVLASRSAELFVMAENLQTQKSGLWCWHYPPFETTSSLQNYYNFIKTEELWPKIAICSSRTRRSYSHYSVYEDKHGTHISNNDLNMMTKLSELETYLDHWEPWFMSTVRVKTLSRLQKHFVKARFDSKWNIYTGSLHSFDEEIRNIQLIRGLDTGFCYEPDRKITNNTGASSFVSSSGNEEVIHQVSTTCKLEKTWQIQKRPDVLVPAEH